MTFFKRTFWVTSVVIALSLTLVSCNTIEGIGNDAKAIGEAVSGAANKTRSY